MLIIFLAIWIILVAVGITIIVKNGKAAPISALGWFLCLGILGIVLWIVFYTTENK